MTKVYIYSDHCGCPDCRAVRLRPDYIPPGDDCEVTADGTLRLKKPEEAEIKDGKL